jgi:hypothetical protein
MVIQDWEPKFHAASVVGTNRPRARNGASLEGLHIEVQSASVA